METTVPEQLSVRQLIRQVQNELQASQQEREEEGDAALFAVEKLTIEVNFVVTESKEFKGGIDLKIVTAGAGKEYVQQQVHKITLGLKAVGPTTDDSPLADLEGHAVQGHLPRGGDLPDSPL